jgi:Predicted acyltransferases
VKLSHVGGIDSLRAVGLVLVVIYHFYTSSLPGGFFGVDMFFVVSGFLVTSLLIREKKEKGKIRLFTFYARRVKRLMPAALFMVVVTLALSLVLATDIRVGMREQTAAVIGWVTNYFEVITGSSYENQFIPHLFVHTWTLGIEMHYYIIWGAVLTIVYALYSRYASRAEEQNRLVYGSKKTIVSDRFILITICLAATLFTYIKMQIQLSGLEDPSPIYYATSTRMYPLMIGSMLGIIVGMKTPKSKVPTPLAFLLLFASVALIVWMSLKFTFADSGTYRYGILAVSLLSVLALYCLLSLQGKGLTLDIPPLAFLGKRSYSIYLFHWPIYNIFKQMTAAGTWPFPKGAPSYTYTILAILVTLLLAEISYRIFEQGRPSPQATQNKGTDGPVTIIQKSKPVKLARVTAIIFAACTVLAIINLATIPENTAIETEYNHQQVLNNAYKLESYNDYLSTLQMNPVALNGRTELLPPTPAELAAAQDVINDANITQQNAQDALNRDDPAGPIMPIPPPGGANVTVIGDSVTLGAAEVIKETLGSVVIDAEVSRNMGWGPDIVNDYVSRGELGEFVVLALFTNAQYNTEPMTHETLAAIPPGHRVIVVTPFGYDYMEPVAEWVRELPKQYDFVTVADWNAAIRDNTDLLAPDGLHMMGNDSRQLYANLLAQAIEQASRKPAKR